MKRTVYFSGSNNRCMPFTKMSSVLFYVLKLTCNYLFDTYVSLITILHPINDAYIQSRLGLGDTSGLLFFPSSSSWGYRPPYCGVPVSL